MSENLGYLSGRKGLRDNLFEAIGQAANPDTPEGRRQLESIRQEFLVGKATVYSAVSFYDFLRPENRNKKAWVCNGSACLLAGTQEKLHSDLRRHLKEEEIGEMCCLGRCHENRAVHIEGKNFSGEFRLEDALAGNCTSEGRLPVALHGEPLLTTDDLTIEELTQLVRQWVASDLTIEIKASGLRGRGGAGFPLATKLSTCAQAAGKEKYIVCNADEGDPGAFSDRYLLEEQPMKVLGGILLAGLAAGASWGVVYIRGEYPESIAVIDRCLQQLYEHQLAGASVAGMDFDFNFKIIRAQGAYICGEETALLNSIEGQRPEVRIRPPYPAQQGLFNQPTVVSNVETLANLPAIATHGGSWFAGIGTSTSTGTKLLSLDGHFNRPGLVEVPMGTPLSAVIHEIGGGFRKPVKALHIGGPLGGLVPISKIKDLTVDFASFQSAGFLLGHASVICIPEEFPLIRYVEHLFSFTAHESCGKCFPCRLGSTRGAELLRSAQQENNRIDRELFNDLLDTLESGSLCMLGGGLPLPVRNALQWFPEEMEKWFKEKQKS